MQSSSAQSALLHQQIQHISLKPQITISYIKAPKNQYTQDIIPNKYEGGYKLWQCTTDFLKYITQNNQKDTINFVGKNVLQIGCGFGLLGIAAMKYGAQFCGFQDYNQEVIQNVTLINVQMNMCQGQKYSLMWGDWDKIGQSATQADKYDVILGSEIIYNPDNYIKIVKLVKRLLKKTGKAIFINKCYYFGVGGNMDDFITCAQDNGLEWESYTKVCSKSGGNKKQIGALKWPQQHTE